MNDPSQMTNQSKEISNRETFIRLRRRPPASGGSSICYFSDSFGIWNWAICHSAKCTETF